MRSRGARRRDVVKKPLFWGILACLVVLWCGYRYVTLPYLSFWGTTAEEQSKILPGDELVPEPVVGKMNTAITIDAPPSKVFPYLLQLGQDRAGFYSYDWLERLFGFGIHNTYTIKPEWQHLSAGDFCTFSQQGMGMRVAIVDQGKTVVLITDSRDRSHKLPPGKWEFFPVPSGKYVVWNWIFHVEEVPGGKTRLYSRTYESFSTDNPILSFALYHGFGLPSLIMNRKLLIGIKHSAESNN